MSDAQNSLTNCIYELALGRCSWDDLLDRLNGALPGSAVLVLGHDLSTGAGIVFSQRGLCPESTSTYLSSYANRYPWLSGEAKLAPLQLYQDEQILPREVAEGTPFYRDWLVRQGNFLGATGMVVLREGMRQLSIQIRYPAADTCQRERATAVLAEASPHFGRAFEIIRRSRFGASYIEELVDDLPFAVFFVDQEMKIHYANRGAEEMRRVSDGALQGGSGALRASDETSDRLLRELVQKTGAARRSPAAVLQFTPANTGQRLLAIAKVASRRAQPYQLHDAILDNGPLVMLVLTGGFDASSLPMDLLWRAFGLTGSEAQLAEALLHGATLAGLAQERAVSKQVLRNQLVGVMRKTGTRRQSELVSLLTRLALTSL